MGRLFYYFRQLYKAFQRFSVGCDATVPVWAHNFLTADSELSWRAFIRQLYRLSVILVEEHPSSTATVCKLAPFCNKSVANVCRNRCGYALGTSAFSSKGLNACW